MGLGCAVCFCLVVVCFICGSSAASFVECYYFVYKLFRVSWVFVILRLVLLGLFRGAVLVVLFLYRLCV